MSVNNESSFLRPTRRLEFTVSWPLQGVARFRSQESELILSDVYWRWIFEEMRGFGDRARSLEFVKAVEEGFDDASHLVEQIPVTTTFLGLLQQIAPSSAPSFEKLVPSPGCSIPTPERVLAELIALVAEAVPCGTIEMAIE